MNAARILLVDDDDGMRLALRRALEHEGHAVIEATNGKHALERLQETTVDLVITDIIMPDAEGLELTFILHKTHPHLPVIVISGGGNLTPEFHLSLARHAGATHVFAKPFVMEDLLAKVRALIPQIRIKNSPPSDQRRASSGSPP